MACVFIALICLILATTTQAVWPPQQVPRSAGQSPAQHVPFSDNINRYQIASGSYFGKALNIVDRFWQLSDDINNNVTEQLSDVNALSSIVANNIKVVFPSSTGVPTVYNGKSALLNGLVATATPSEFLRTIVQNPIGYTIKGDDVDVILDYFLTQEYTDDADGRIDVGFYKASTVVNLSTGLIEYIMVDFDGLPGVYWTYT